MYKGKKVYAINYADEKFRHAQTINTKTAYLFGRVDEVIEYNPESIDAEYRELHKDAFRLYDVRSGKFGLWRPNIIMQTLEKMEYGEYCVYCDSGALYFRNVNRLIDCMERNAQEIMVFELYLPEKEWSKRDIFIVLDADEDRYTDSGQRLSTHFIFKKTEKTIKFFDNYYQLTLSDPYIFTDEDNRCGMNNYPEFQDTRHNQSVLSILSKKNGLLSFRDPSQWGGMFFLNPSKKYLNLDAIHNRSNYPTIFLLHRMGTVTLSGIVRLLKEIRYQYKDRRNYIG